MALSIPSVPNPFDPNNPFTNVYGWNAGVYLDISQDSGRIVLNVNTSPDNWEAQPITQFSMVPGEVAVPAIPGDPTQDPPIPDTPAVTIATLDELMNETTTIGDTGLTFAQCYATIGARLYQEWLKYPALSQRGGP